MTGLVPRGWSQGIQGRQVWSKAALRPPGSRAGGGAPHVSEGSLNPAAPGGALPDPSTCVLRLVPPKAFISCS